MNRSPYLTTYYSPVGVLTLASDGTQLTGLWLEHQKYFGSTLAPNATEQNLVVFAQTIDWLNRYFHGEAPAMTLPLAPEGSAFRQTVWDILFRIPYGETMTYGQIAVQLEQQTGKRISAQAVGGAVGHNPISILIPCHRVLGADGSLTGYAGGLRAKAQLLTLEGAHFRT
ncbi:methylated-DNA--[protein]-cysteine S-methyltransferase [Butyricicoccus porcorum]|uniref:methylated-DNA--[protein]-cysteine S-methyltransferase n=1 Tax=Butyricicoccus porcorum TaxID=1945634 RepID=UPI003F4AF60A